MQRPEIILSPSNNYFSIAKQTSTAIYSTQTQEKIYQIPQQSNLVSFQFETGLFSIVNNKQPTMLSIYDFKYKRHVKDLDFISPIVKILYIRNLILVASKQRILVYDLSKQQNVSYIGIRDGQKCFFSQLYQNLRIGYITGNLFISHSLWTDEKFQIQQTQFQQGRYSYDGEYFVHKIRNANDGSLQLKVYTYNSLINIIHLSATFMDFTFSPLQSQIRCLLIVDNCEPQKGVSIKSEPLFRVQQASEVWKLSQKQPIWNSSLQLGNVKSIYSIRDKVYLHFDNKKYVFQICSQK